MNSNNLTDDIINIYMYIICLLTGNWRSIVDLVLENHWLVLYYKNLCTISVIHADDFIILADIKWLPIYSGRKLEVKKWLVAKMSLAVAALWRWPVIGGHLYRKSIWIPKLWPLSGGGRSHWWSRQVILYLFILRPNIYKSSCLNSHFIPNNSGLVC